jgi:hypothetical protein
MFHAEERTWSVRMELQMSLRVGLHIEHPTILTLVQAIVMATWVIRPKNRPFETEKELHPLLANTGGLGYNQTSSIASSCSNDETLT